VWGRVGRCIVERLDLGVFAFGLFESRRISDG
jgi:hypothetical protein